MKIYIIQMLCLQYKDSLLQTVWGESYLVYEFSFKGEVVNIAASYTCSFNACNARHTNYFLSYRDDMTWFVWRVLFLIYEENKTDSYLYKRAVHSSPVDSRRNDLTNCNQDPQEDQQEVE